MPRITRAKPSRRLRLPKRAAGRKPREQTPKRRRPNPTIPLTVVRKRSNPMIAYLQRYFISGLLIWLPILVTVFVIKFLVDLLSKSLLLLPNPYQPDVLLGFHVPGIGVILTLLVIFFTGLLAANFLGRRLM